MNATPGLPEAASRVREHHVTVCRIGLRLFGHALLRAPEAMGEDQRWPFGTGGASARRDRHIEVDGRAVGLGPDRDHEVLDLHCQVSSRSRRSCDRDHRLTRAGRGSQRHGIPGHGGDHSERRGSGQRPASTPPPASGGPRGPCHWHILHHGPEALAMRDCVTSPRGSPGRRRRVGRRGGRGP